MARTLIEAPLTTRSARTSLKPGIYWRSIDVDLHLGYRRAHRGGKWLARCYIAHRKTYRRFVLGGADDIIQVGSLSYDEASKLARTVAADFRTREAELAAGPPLTVRSVVEPYILMRDKRATVQEGREVRSDGSRKLTKYVLADSDFCELWLSALNEDRLIHWQTSLPSHLKRVTRCRIVNDLKAALNAAYRVHRKLLPPDFREIVRVGLSFDLVDGDYCPDVGEGQILPDEKIRALVEASFSVDDTHDFGRLVLTLASTGARFSQLKRMKVKDVQLDQCRLFVPKSRKGNHRTGGFTTVRIGSDVVEALRPIVVGRPPDEPLFCRWRHIQIGPAKWKRVSRDAWKVPTEMLRHWKTVCQRAGVHYVVPYALRHSSIVRGIRTNLPIRLVAALHDTSVVMIERHYSRWIADGLEDLAARAIIPLMRKAA